MNSDYGSVREKLKQWEAGADRLTDSGPDLMVKVVSACVLSMVLETLRSSPRQMRHPAEIIESFLATMDSQVQFLHDWERLSPFRFGSTPSARIEFNDLPRRLSRTRELFDYAWTIYERSREDDDQGSFSTLMEIAKRRLVENGLNAAYFMGKRCLDAGCGTGRFSFVMEELGANSVVGVDVNPQNLKYAQEIATRRDSKRVRFISMDCADLQAISEGPFDFVISNGVIHHMEDPYMALRQCHRCLKSGGELWLYVGGRGGLFNDVWEAIKYAFRSADFRDVYAVLKQLNFKTNKIYNSLDGMFAYYWYFDLDELRSQLEAMGFTDIRELRVTEPTDLDVELVRSTPENAAIIGGGDFRLLMTKV